MPDETKDHTQIKITVYDSVADSWHVPRYFINRATAIRSIREAVNDPRHEYGRFPADFTIFESGTFCENTGDEIIYAAKQKLCQATDLITPPEIATLDPRPVMPAETPRNAAAAQKQSA